MNLIAKANVKIDALIVVMDNVMMVSGATNVMISGAEDAMTNGLQSVKISATNRANQKASVRMMY